MLDNLDLNAIHDENARELIRQVLNLVEKLTADMRDLQVENQRLRDEVNRLKGEQGKPKAKGKSLKRKPTAVSGRAPKPLRRSAWGLTEFLNSPSGMADMKPICA